MSNYWLDKKDEVVCRIKTTKGRLIEFDFDSWFEKLVKCFERIDYGQYPIDAGKETWRYMFDNGYSPEETMVEDMSCWSE